MALTSAAWAGRPRLRHATRLGLLGTGGLMLALGAGLATSPWMRARVLGVLAQLQGTPVPADWPRNLAATGVEFAGIGLLLVMLGSSLEILKPRLAQIMASDRRIIAVFAALLVLIWLPVVVVGHGAWLDGQRTWWLSDDAAISLTYARNLATGHGLVWNPGDGVEGYTNFLWAVYLAAVQVLPVPQARVALAVMLTNIALACATLPPLVGVVRRLGGGSTAKLLTLGCFVLSRSELSFAASGMETTLLTCVFVWSLYRVLTEGAAGRSKLSTYALIGILAIVRADGIVLSALLCVLALWLARPISLRLLLLIGVSLLIPVAHLVFRLAYYHEWIPNTAYLKTMYLQSRYQAGIGYVGRFLVRHVFLVGVALLGAAVLKQPLRRVVAVGVCAYIGYVAYIGGDTFGNFRYFVVLLPVIMALAFTGIESVPVPGWFPVRRWVMGLACMLTIPLASPGYAVMLAYPYPGDPGNVAIGLFLRDHTPATSRVADVWAGNVFYFSQRYAIDLLGKSDKVIARLPAVSDGLLPGHNKFDYAYSLGVLKPDYVVAPWKLPVDEEDMRRRSSGNFAFEGRLYFDPTFRTHCLPHPLPSETWRTVFECRW